jgi:F0F1-type ATP synthase epsilon subunit
MTVALEIAFAAGFAVVAVSLAAVVLSRVPDRLLVASAVSLGLLAVAAAVVAGIEIAEGSAEEELLIVTAGGLLVAAVAQTSLVVLARGLRRVRDLDAVEERTRATLDARLEQHAEERKVELERTLARERANASYVLGE